MALGLVASIMMLVFAYTAARFPNGPIVKCESGYCSTYHNYPQTVEEYRAFKAWEKTIFVVWPIGMLLLFLLQPAKENLENDPKIVSECSRGTRG